MPRVTLLLSLQIASLVGFALTLFRIYRLGLCRRYRFFFLYFISRIIIALGALALDQNSKTYFYFWLCSQPVSWMFYVLVIRELTGLILEKYIGLKTLGRWFMYASTVVSLAVSVLSLLLRINPTISARSKVMGYVFAIDRGVTASLAVFLLVLLALLSRYPVRLQQNVVLHSFLYTIYFLSNSLTMLMVSLFGVRVYGAVSTALTAAASACGFAWFFLLTTKGEEVTVHVPHVNKGQEDRLMSQLDYLNQTLIKSAKS